MIEIMHSAEARWFFRGMLPTKILDWFRVRSDIVSSERSDWYLVFPGCESLGVKQREGKFEIKAIRGASETVHYTRHISARSDAWAKWSYGEKGVDAWIAELQKDRGGWVEVTKKRWLRRFSLDGQILQEVDTTVYPDEGCHVELTAVRVGDSDWWTIGLEGFGEMHRVRRNLSLVAEYFFEENEPPWPLDTSCSCSYPVWLNGLTESASTN